MQRPSLSSPFFLVLATALAPITWGSTYLVTTEFLPPNLPLSAAVIRTLPAGVLLVLLTRNFQPTVPWGRLLTLAIVNIGAFQALLFVAAYRMPGGLAAVVGALQPVIVLALAWSVDRDRPRPVAIGAALIGLAGMALLFVSPETHFDPIGIGAAFTGTASMAAGTFLARRWQNGMPVLAFTGWQLGLGGLVLLPLALWMDPALPPLSVRQGMGYGYLGIVGTLFAYAVWFRGISRLSPVAVSALGLLSPITAIALGWCFLGQSLRGREISGIFVILLSIAALQFRPASSPAVARPNRVQIGAAATGLPLR